MANGEQKKRRGGPLGNSPSGSPTSRATAPIGTAATMTAVVMSPPPRAPQADGPETSKPNDDYESLRQYVDAQLTLARDRIDSQRDDYLKLRDVVEDRFTHHQTLVNEVVQLKADMKIGENKLASKVDLHEASGKVMEQCEQLISNVRTPIKTFKDQVEKALHVVDAVQTNMDTFITGAFNICENNLKLLEKEVLDLKDSSGPGVKVLTAVRDLEEKFANLTQDTSRNSRWTSTNAPRTMRKASSSSSGSSATCAPIWKA